MISCVTFVPAGCADPRPKRHEMSAAEEAALQSLQSSSEGAGGAEGDAGKGGGQGLANVKGLSSSSSLRPQNAATSSDAASSSLPLVDISSLPADLRMDTYDSDEEGAEGDGLRVGNILMGRVGSDMVQDESQDGGVPEEFMVEEEDVGGESGSGAGAETEAGENSRESSGAARKGKGKGKGKGKEDSDEEENSDDDDSDQDLSDDEYDPLQSDDREYEPTNTSALASMKIGFEGGGGGEDEGDDSEDSDDDDTNLRPTDVLALSATTDPTDDFSTLEVYVYEPPTGNLYVHHDITLPAFPLCVEWGDVGPSGGTGSFAAIGTFKQGIEVWNLDVLDPLEPTCTLGGAESDEFEAYAADSLEGSRGKGKVSRRKRSPVSLLRSLRICSSLEEKWLRVLVVLTIPLHLLISLHLYIYRHPPSRLKQRGRRGRAKRSCARGATRMPYSPCPGTRLTGR